MNSVKYKSNLWKLSWVLVARNFLLSMPIITIFFQSRGLSLTEIMILQVVFSVAVVILEVPSGYLADLFKRKTLLSWGALFATIGYVSYALAYDFWSILWAELALAISASFISGSDSALLYESLLAIRKEKSYAKWQGRIFAFTRVSESVAALLGGFLTVVSITAPFWFQVPFLASAFFVSLFIVEPPRQQKRLKANPFKEMWQLTVYALHKQQKLKWLIMTYALLSTSSIIFVWLAQPYFKQIGVPILYFGLIWAALNMLSAISSSMAYKVEKLFGLRKTMILLMLMPIVAYVGVAVFDSSLLGLVFVPLFWLLWGFQETVLKDYAQQQIESSVRATLLSVKSFAARASFSILAPLAGLLADYKSLTWTFWASVAFLLVTLSWSVFKLVSVYESRKE